MTFADVRASFPIFERFTYLNHASTAPLCVQVQAAMREAAELQADGSVGSEALKARIAPLKAHLAQLINATPEEIALVRNTTEGLNTIASGVLWKPGENVVANTLEFPANIYPWLNQGTRYGLNTKLVPARHGKVLVEDLIHACDAGTRLITVSAVQFLTGDRVDLERLGAFCRARGIYLCVDAIQALGPVELDVGRCQIDFLASGAHKWLLGPMGVGFLYIRQPLQSQLWPPAVSHFGMRPSSDSLLDYDFTFRPTAEKFEGGLPNYAGIFGFEAAVRLLSSVGWMQIRQQVALLSDHLRSGLAERGSRLLSSGAASERSAIVTFVSDHVPSPELFARLQGARVIVSLREHAIRVAPYFYNTIEDIEELLGVVPRR